MAMEHFDSAASNRPRTAFALLALALGGFAIGAAEFVALGLLPELARGLLPGLYAASPEAAVAQAGWLVSAYALGVVLGAPTIGVVAPRYPKRLVLVVLLVVATVTTLASALGPTFGFVLGARFLSALPHGAYFGVASLMASSLLGPGKRAGGIALVLSGLTAATVVGVPLLTVVGQDAGWRGAFLLVSGIFALAVVAVAALVPAQPGDAGSTIRRELRVFRRSVVWMALGTTTIGFGGFFAVYSYVSTMATDVADLSAAWVPAALVMIGAGMFIGNLAGGWLSDRSVPLALFGGFSALIVTLLVLLLFAGTPAGLMVGVFLVGVTAMSLSPTMQARLSDVMQDSPSLAGALNQSAINLGNGFGAYLGGVVIAAGLGYIAPAWVGILLALAGIALALLGYRIEARVRTAPGRKCQAGNRRNLTMSGQ